MVWHPFLYKPATTSIHRTTILDTLISTPFLFFQRASTPTNTRFPQNCDELKLPDVWSSSQTFTPFPPFINAFLVLNQAVTLRRMAPRAYAHCWMTSEDPKNIIVQQETKFRFKKLIHVKVLNFWTISLARAIDIATAIVEPYRPKVCISRAQLVFFFSN